MVRASSHTPGEILRMIEQRDRELVPREEEKDRVCAAFRARHGHGPSIPQLQDMMRPWDEVHPEIRRNGVRLREAFDPRAAA